MLLELAEQSIQLLQCHTSRWRLCHRSPQDNQSKSWKKCGLWFFCHWSLLMPLAPAGQSIQLLMCHTSRWRLCHRSPQDNQSKPWKKVWPLFFLSLITSHSISTSRAEHTTSYLSCKQMKTLSSFTTRQPIQVLKKSVTSVFLSLIISLLLTPLAPVEQSIQLLIGAEQQLLLYHTTIN